MFFKTFLVRPSFLGGPAGSVPGGPTGKGWSVQSLTNSQSIASINNPVELGNSFKRLFAIVVYVFFTMFLVINVFPSGRVELYTVCIECSLPKNHGQKPGRKSGQKSKKVLSLESKSSISYHTSTLYICMHDIFTCMFEQVYMWLTRRLASLDVLQYDLITCFLQTMS